MAKPKKHYFNRIDDERLIHLAYEGMARERAFVNLWLKGHNEVESYEALAYDAKNKALHLGPHGLLSLISGTKFLDKPVLFKAGEGPYHYFGEAVLTFDQDSKNYVLTWVNSLHQSRQRTNYRIQSNHMNKIRLTVDGVKDYVGRDISAGGLSFLFPASKAELFPKGGILMRPRVHYNSMELIIPSALIVGVRKSTEYNQGPQLQAGVAFKDLPTSLEHKLAKYINGQARYQELIAGLSKKN